MRLKWGSNRFKHTYKYPLGLTKDAWYTVIVTALFLFIVGCLFFLSNRKPQKIISPVPQGYIHRPVVVVKEVIAVEKMTVDTWVDKYVRKYTSDEGRISYYKQLMHCLLHYESKYYFVKRCGDHGKSCGILQFREATYNNYRRRMIKQGFATELKSRFDEEASIDTAAFIIIKNNGAGNWGPYKRGTCN